MLDTYRTTGFEPAGVLVEFEADVRILTGGWSFYGFVIGARPIATTLTARGFARSEEEFRAQCRAKLHARCRLGTVRVVG